MRISVKYSVYMITYTQTLIFLRTLQGRITSAQCAGPLLVPAGLTAKRAAAVAFSVARKPDQAQPIGIDPATARQVQMHHCITHKSVSSVYVANSFGVGVRVPCATLHAYPVQANPLCE